MSIRSSRFLLLAASASLLAACNSTVTPAADTVAPTVAISAAPNPLTTTGTVAVSVTASDDKGVAKVELYDNTLKVGEDLSAPYTFSRTYGPDDSIVHTLTARAYDLSGNTADATTMVKVNISSLTLTADQPVLSYPGPVTLTAVTNADIGHTISKVEFLENGVLLSTATAAPYTATVNYTAFQNGVHTITARSTDDAGKTVTATTTVNVMLDASEPNESVATAKAIVIGSRIDGSIAGLPRDQDYFSFAAKAGDQLHLTVKSQSIFANSTLDPYVEVLLPDGRSILEKDDDSGRGLESDLLFNITVDGTYYIHLTSFSIHDDPLATDNKLTNTYRMELTRR